MCTVPVAVVLYACQENIRSGLLATNEYHRYASSLSIGLYISRKSLSVGGGFGMNERTKASLFPDTSILADLSTDYKGIKKSDVDPFRLSQQYSGDPEHPKPAWASRPPYLFKSGETLLAMTEKCNASLGNGSDETAQTVGRCRNLGFHASAQHIGHQEAVYPSVFRCPYFA